MGPVRASRAPFLLALALGLPGCSGFAIGVRQDKEEAAQVARALAARAPDRPFPARTLLDVGWTRLWVFRGGIGTQEIEDRIGIPFPYSGEDTPPEESYLVFADREQVVASFSWADPPAVSARCFLAERTPLTPDAPLELRSAGGGAPRLVAVADAARCR